MSLELGDTPRNDEGDDERGLYSQAYRSFRWLYISPSDELLVTNINYIRELSPLSRTSLKLNTHFSGIENN